MCHPGRGVTVCLPLTAARCLVGPQMPAHSAGSISTSRQREAEAITVSVGTSSSPAYRKCLWLKAGSLAVNRVGVFTSEFRHQIVFRLSLAFVCVSCLSSESALPLPLSLLPQLVTGLLAQVYLASPCLPAIRKSVHRELCTNSVQQACFHTVKPRGKMASRNAAAVCFLKSSFPSDPFDLSWKLCAGTFLWSIPPQGIRDG